MASAMTSFVAILMALATIGEVVARDLPEFLHICNVQDSNFNTCVISSIEFLKPYLKVGVPEYNLPSLEPLTIKHLAASPPGLRILLKNLDLYGVTLFNIKKFKSDMNNLRFIANIVLPNIRIEGEYDLDGKLVLLQIKGSGPLHGNITDVVGTCKIQAERYKDESGVEKIRINDFRLKISVTKGMIRLDDLFQGDQAMLGDVVNSAVNSNFDFFINELKPPVEKTLSEAFKKAANAIVILFSFDQLFPGA